MSATRLEMWRHTDVTGVSGTGLVAEGIRFSDGRVVLRWLSKMRSTAVYDSLEDARAIHGHDGKTVILCVGDAYVRGGRDAAQDRCENIRNVLNHEQNGSPFCPDYISMNDWPAYLKGYEDSFFEMWGRLPPWREEG